MHHALRTGVAILRFLLFDGVAVPFSSVMSFVVPQFLMMVQLLPIREYGAADSAMAHGMCSRRIAAGETPRRGAEEAMFFDGLVMASNHRIADASHRGLAVLGITGGGAAWGVFAGDGWPRMGYGLIKCSAGNHVDR